MPRQLSVGVLMIVRAPQRSAVRQRSKGAVEGEQMQAVTRKIELADDLRPQQRHHIRADREPEAREDLFRDRRAANHVTAFDTSTRRPARAR